MSRHRALANEGIQKTLEAAENDGVDFDNDMYDTNYQDLHTICRPHECETDFEVDAIPQNPKVDSALCDIGRFSFSSINNVPPDATSDYYAVLWLRAAPCFNLA
ncbi:hypothetical protein AVEN_186670-1 [Araneus ventricosus]|uniref:Uncharacterized protein n=1 Tax=Araneus ventricosus TaxID=182803 RepID=A0A4Y2G7K8_ARAVE|nr:hypothetical protein AVEN_186670-1 [Araneus ventricosus]